MQPITVDNTVLIGYTGGMHFGITSWERFRIMFPANIKAKTFVIIHLN